MKIWHVDAFAREPFTGNPAAIVLLDRSLDDARLALLTDELNLQSGRYDFVSRYSKPLAVEDPVTGSAHCALAPFWAERLARERVGCSRRTVRSTGRRLYIVPSTRRGGYRATSR